MDARDLCLHLEKAALAQGCVRRQVTELGLGCSLSVNFIVRTLHVVILRIQWKFGMKQLNKQLTPCQQ